MINKYIIFASLSVSVLFSCEDKPKIIVADATGTENGGITAPTDGNVPGTPSPGGAAGTADVHQVMASEILQAERYTYLKVDEGGKHYWIATAKMEAEKGKTYLYRGGLMKTNFESLEFKRTFDTIYLVGNVIDASAHPGGNLSQAGGPGVSPGSEAIAASVSSAGSPGEAKNAVKLSELFKNKKKYNGQVITVSGECVKVNNGIMGRNWIHLRDGSKEGGKPIDLTITSQIAVPVGAKIAMTGKITLDKDFGAGYRYDIIMEDAGN